MTELHCKHTLYSPGSAIPALMSYVWCLHRLSPTISSLPAPNLHTAHPLTVSQAFPPLLTACLPRVFFTDGSLVCSQMYCVNYENHVTGTRFGDLRKNK